MSTDRASRFELLLAALWGLAEATVFFVVPDVILSTIGLKRGFRAGLVAAFATALAAASGGAVLAIITRSNTLDVFRALDALPGISSAMIATVVLEVANANWPLALLQGSFSGVPYKVYAAGAGAVGLPVVWFALVSVPVRLARFALVVGAVSLLRGSLERALGPRAALTALAGFWIAFYALFWALMPG